MQFLLPRVTSSLSENVNMAIYIYIYIDILSLSLSVVGTVYNENQDEAHTCAVEPGIACRPYNVFRQPDTFYPSTVHRVAVGAVQPLLGSRRNVQKPYTCSKTSTLLGE